MYMSDSDSDFFSRSVNVCDNKAQHCRTGDGKIECELNNDCLHYFPDIDVAEEWSFVPLKGLPCI